MSEPIAEFRDSAGVLDTAMFGRTAHFLFGLVGPENLDLQPKIGSLVIVVLHPGPDPLRRPPGGWRLK